MRNADEEIDRLLDENERRRAEVVRLRADQGHASRRP